MTFLAQNGDRKYFFHSHYAGSHGNLKEWTYIGQDTVASLLGAGYFNNHGIVGISPGDRIRYLHCTDRDDTSTVLGVILFSVTSFTPSTMAIATDQIAAPAGTLASPSIGIGTSDKGFYEVNATTVGFAVNGAQTFRTAPGLMTIERPGGLNAHYIASAEGPNVLFWGLKHRADATGPEFIASKARGTIAAPAAVVQNDQTGHFRGQGWDGAAFRSSGLIRYTMIAAAPSASDFESRLTFFLVPSGSGTLSEAMRLDHATGLTVNGAFNFAPGSSVTPANNGEVMFELTNDTTLTIKAKGNDGTVRTVALTLAV